MKQPLRDVIMSPSWYTKIWNEKFDKENYNHDVRKRIETTYYVQYVIVLKIILHWFFASEM